MVSGLRGSSSECEVNLNESMSRAFHILPIQSWVHSERYQKQYQSFQSIALE